MARTPWVDESELNASLTVRLPAGVVDVLDDLAVRLNVPRSEVVRAAFYGVTGPKGWPEKHPTPQTLSAIHRQLEKA
jgi:hypothetical protein